MNADACGELLLGEPELATAAKDLRRQAEVVAERVRLSLRLGPSRARLVLDLTPGAERR